MSRVTIEVSDRVAAAMQDILSLAAENTVFGPRRMLLHAGIEAIADARPGNEGETSSTTCLVDGDGDWWVFKNRFWYCLGAGDEFDASEEATVGPTFFIGPDAWEQIADRYRIKA